MIVSAHYNLFLFLVEEMKNKQVNFELTNFKIYSKNKGEHTLNCERNLFNSVPSDKKKKSG